MKNLLIIGAALFAFASNADAQMATAKRIPQITSKAVLTDLTVQHAYSLICDYDKYVEYSNGLIKSITPVSSTSSNIVVTLKDDSKYEFSVAPNTNYNTISFSIVKPTDLKNIGFIVMVDEAGDKTKVSIGASGDVSKELREKAKAALDQYFEIFFKNLQAI